MALCRNFSDRKTLIVAALGIFLIFLIIFITFIVLPPTSGDDIVIIGSYGTCAGRCIDVNMPMFDCQCNTGCEQNGDCCSDYEFCYSCVGRCGLPYYITLPCQCNTECVKNGDCCVDYDMTCASSKNGNITDQDISDISQKIWNADADKILMVNISLQSTIDDGSTADMANGSLFKTIPVEVSKRPIYQTLTALFDNYISDDSISENQTIDKWKEVDNFLTEAMKSQPLKLTQNLLASKGLVSSDPPTFQEELKEIWFWLYNRSNTYNSSSGGEHVFLGEKKGKIISGLHNWVRFAKLESEGSINYIGYVKYLDFKGTYVIRNPFYWDDAYKAVGSFFIGTSPAFELSVYTLCFYARPNSGDCTLNINGNSIKIQTYTMDSYGKQLVATAYPTDF